MACTWVAGVCSSYVAHAWVLSVPAVGGSDAGSLWLQEGSRNWNGVGCGKVLGIQNLESGTVSPIGRTLTSSGWSGLCLSGRNPLGFESGLSSRACKLLGRCGQREWSWGTEFHISVLNICTQNIREFKLQLKPHIDPHILIVGDFNIQLLPKQVTQTKTKQKFS